jgi:intraflagellar transport protein 74
MRPNSRGGIPGTASGQPPGTGSLRPGSGRRLQTGMKVSGPGTQAAQGVALSASINVSDRPMTGQGVKGMKVQGVGSGKLVEDQSYYVGLLRKKLKDVADETRRLQEEIEQSGKDSSQFVQLERKFDNLLKNKEMLEGTHADYNLALDKTRTSTDPDDVMQLSYQLIEKNRQSSQELDRIFMQRKQREADTTQLEEQIEKYHASVQQRISSLDPAKQRAYSDLMNKQREFQERMLLQEQKIAEVNDRIRQFESDERGHAHRREYVTLEKQIQKLRREIDDAQAELQITELDPKEAHQKFVARVNQHKQTTKTVEDTIARTKEEILSLKRGLEETSDATATAENDDESAKYELLFKRDQDMTAFIDKFDESRDGVLEEQNQTRNTIVALLEHISRTVDESSNMPSQDQLGEMEDTKAFKERNLMTAQKTMENLQAEKRKREKELETLKNSEPKLRQEIDNLREEMQRLQDELNDFEDIEGVKRRYERNKVELNNLHVSYIKRRDGMRQQMQSVSAEHDGLKKLLASNDTARELEETERRLKQAEKCVFSYIYVIQCLIFNYNVHRVIFDLREFIDIKSRETEYESIKANCLKVF